MTKHAEAGLPGGTQNQQPWTDPDLPPDQFLYERKGPWPQPAPAYPMTRPPEVLTIPPVEVELWKNTIGWRYEKTVLEYTAPAFIEGAYEKWSGIALPTDDQFTQIMTHTVYSRFLRREASDAAYWSSDFTAMELIDPLSGMYCAPVVCRFQLIGTTFSCVSITFLKTATRNAALVVTPQHGAWNLAKVYALQGAAYHALFVVHPTLHFPMDSVNAITKTAVPMSHPLYLALIPHTAYTLQLDNAVLESAWSVANDKVHETWFDPLTAEGYNIKQLFGVGYSGYKGLATYPAFDYMAPWMDTDILYGQCLQKYFEPFLAFATKIASVIPKTDPYVRRWADYCSAHVRGFPDGAAIFEGDNLARAMAIYMWDVSVAHSADHFSFGVGIALTSKFLRLRRPPPVDINDGHEVKTVSDLVTAEDLGRAILANDMVFSVITMKPNLIETQYAFTDPVLMNAAAEFHVDLKSVDAKVRAIMPEFMRLEPDSNAQPAYPYEWTISASIQF
jgi:hypothetical protein